MTAGLRRKETVFDSEHVQEMSSVLLSDELTSLSMGTSISSLGSLNTWELDSRSIDAKAVLYEHPLPRIHDIPGNRMPSIINS